MLKKCILCHWNYIYIFPVSFRKQHRNVLEKDADFFSHSLFIEATTATGGVAVFGDGLGDLSIKFITKSLWDALPWYNDNYDNSIGTVVPGPMPHQAQQLLFLAAATDHLQGADTK